MHPDLVISDIKMPFMDGLELAKHIHEDYMNTKVILFSGWDDFEYAKTRNQLWGIGIYYETHQL